MGIQIRVSFSKRNDAEDLDHAMNRYHFRGGGTIAGSVFLTEAQQEKEKLETMLQEGRGFGEAPPPMFVIG